MMSDDARSDFVLAAAGAVLIPMIAQLVFELPPYGWLPLLVRQLLLIGWGFASLAFVPWVISRHRGQGNAAFELDGDRTAVRRGTLIAIPIVVLGTVRAYSLLGTGLAALGQAGIPLYASPAVAPLGLDQLVVQWTSIVVLAFGLVIFTGFLVNRAREAFRSVDLPLVEALRTYGTGAAGVALLTGILVALRGDIGFTFALGGGLTVFALVLLADRLVDLKASTTRSAILAPAIVTLALHILATGGLFGGDILFGVWLGSLGFGLMVVVASLAGTKAFKLAWVMPVAASALWPSCLATAGYAQIGGGFCGLV